MQLLTLRKSCMFSNKKTKQIWAEIKGPKNDHTCGCLTAVQTEHWNQKVTTKMYVSHSHKQSAFLQDRLLTWSPILYCCSSWDFQQRPALCSPIWAVCISEWRLWQPNYTSTSEAWALTEIDLTLSTSRESMSPRKARLSVRPGAQFVCSVITQIVAVPW